jgi:fucose permease
MGKQNKFWSLVPLMLGFFIMGYCDLIGVASNYVKQDFNLTDTAANFYSTMLFLWFLVLSVPTGMLMNRIGKKKTVLLSMVVTLVAMIVPYIAYNNIAMVIAFSLLGIGNTLIQVSLNPLVANMVSGEKQASFLTLGQFIKAIASFFAPIIATQAFVHYGDWKLLFVLFGIIDIIAIIWLYLTKVEEDKESAKFTSLGRCFKLLGNGTVLLLFIGILMHVGIDVGINITAPKILVERVGMALKDAAYATSVYFLLRTIGCFTGSFIMSKFSPAKFFVISVLLILLGVAGLFFVNTAAMIYVCVGLIGFGNSNVFSIIFSSALRYLPERNDEISGLMIMGVSGGAIVPLIMGAASDSMGSQLGAVMVLAVCILYLVILSAKIVKLEKKVSVEENAK